MSSPPPSRNNPSEFARQFSMALELPIVLVLSVLLGGAIGYFLDRWLHKDSLFTLIFGALGFAAGITDVIRRLTRAGKPAECGKDNNDRD
jgi:F0F1-type ATP synthase assembly protein I